MASIRFGRLVLPGQRLGVVEEYLPGTEVKALKSGHLVATHLGYAEFDRRNHIVSVRPLRAVRSLLMTGSLVVPMAHHSVVDSAENRGPVGPVAAHVAEPRELEEVPVGSKEVDEQVHPNYRTARK
jgi:exosome complex RNA-binding protein Csl4